MDRERVFINDNSPYTILYRLCPLEILNSVRTFVGPSIIIGVTVAVEEFASFILFECPCNASHRLYGMAYLLGPAILLLLLGLFWQNKLWRLVTGSFRRTCCSLTLILESWKKNPKRGTINERVLRKKNPERSIE